VKKAGWKAADFGAPHGGDERGGRRPDYHREAVKELGIVRDRALAGGAEGKPMNGENRRPSA